MIKHFRFSKEDIPRLLAALKIPQSYTCSSGTKATGMEALMVVLRRLAYPNRLCDLTKLFGRSPPELSTIFNTVRFVLLLVFYFNVIHDRPLMTFIRGSRIFCPALTWSG